MHGGGGNGSDTGGFTSEPGNYETLFKFDDSKPMWLCMVWMNDYSREILTAHI